MPATGPRHPLNWAAFAKADAELAAEVEHVIAAYDARYSTFWQDGEGRELREKIERGTYHLAGARAFAESLALSTRLFEAHSATTPSTGKLRIGQAGINLGWKVHSRISLYWVGTTYEITAGRRKAIVYFTRAGVVHAVTYRRHDGQTRALASSTNGKAQWVIDHLTAPA